MEFVCSTRILFGLEALKAYCADRVLVVTDEYFSRSGKALEIGKLAGREVRVFDEVVPDPPAELAAKGAALCEVYKPQVLIALGGGSPMDCAKGIRLGYSGQVVFIAVPTTSGSGSEVTSFSILTRDGVKQVVVDDLLRPDAAVLEEGLLMDLPKTLIADTGMDLLAHCIEALGAKGRNGITDALALQGASIVMGHLAASWQGDRRVRGLIHQAAAMAGMAFDNAGLGLCHAMAHVLGGALHMPHGRLCAILLPHVMAANEAALPQYAHLARVCGVGGATAKLSLRNLTTALVRLRTSMEMPASLPQLTNVPQLVQDILADPCCQSNPEPVTAELVERILKAVSR